MIRKVFLQERFSASSSSVVRASAIGAIRLLDSPQSLAGFGEYVVMAQVKPFLNDGTPHVALNVFALTRDFRRDAVILVYIDPETDQTVTVEYPIGAIDAEAEFDGISVLVRLSPPEALTRLGKEKPGEGLLVANPLAGHLHGYMGAVPVYLIPDSSAAVGLRRSDGTYTNFVPLLWPEERPQTQPAPD